MQVKSLVTEVLQEYDIGLTLVDVKIQDAEPPTQEVIEAFKAVETAKQQAETVVNQAKAYQNAQIPKAEGQADQLIQNAEYLKRGYRAGGHVPGHVSGIPAKPGNHPLPDVL